jgi:UDP-glucose 4-epimerase
VRDYIHVMDLAEGHVAAMRYLSKPHANNYLILNLGTGAGHSVLELVSLYGKVSCKPIPFEIAPRRPGDIDSCYAKVDRAGLWLSWDAKRTLKKMCEDSLRWQKMAVDSDK